MSRFIRKRLDVDHERDGPGLDDLVAAEEGLEARVLEAYFGDFNDVKGRAVVALSVRTAFDALLSELALPNGSSVLMSSVQISDMYQIVLSHGLVPVRVPVDASTLVPSEEAWSIGLNSAKSQVRMAVLAQLFGARTELKFEFPDDVFVVEDNAEGFFGTAFERRRFESVYDALLTSFGTIKTATAFGCGVLEVKNAALAGAIRSRLSRYPAACSNFEFVAKWYAYSKANQTLTTPEAFGLLSKFFSTRNALDEFITKKIRGFDRNEPLRPQLRKRPCASQLVLLERRLRGLDNLKSDCFARLEYGSKLAQRLSNVVKVPGRDARFHSYWLFPVVVENRESVMDRLLEDFKIDATAGATQLSDIRIDAAAGATRLSDVCEAEELDMTKVFYIPPPVCEEDVARLERAMRAACCVSNIRPSLASATEFKPTADVSDAFPNDSRPLLPGRLKSFGNVRRFSGLASTVKTLEDNTIVKRALSTPGMRRVLVVDGGSSLSIALLGDNLAHLAQQNDWAGVVVCGAIRDASIIPTRAPNLGVFALGTCPRRSEKRNLGLTNVELELEGVRVVPNESMVICDEDGVLILNPRGGARL